MYRLAASIAIPCLSFATPAAADCRVSGLIAKVITPPNSEIPDGGGFVVAAIAHHDGALAPGDAAVRPKWHARIGSTAITPTIELLAPGLATYRVTKTGSSSLEDDSGEVVGRATIASTKRDRLAAPRVRGLRYERSPNTMHSSEIVTAELDEKIPDGALAIVVSDLKGKPRSFHVIQPGKPITPYYRFDCTPLPNGTIASHKGDRVTLSWVDAAGRKSPESAPITIR